MMAIVMSSYLTSDDISTDRRRPARGSDRGCRGGRRRCVGASPPWRGWDHRRILQNRDRLVRGRGRVHAANHEACSRRACRRRLRGDPAFPSGAAPGSRGGRCAGRAAKDPMLLPLQMERREGIEVEWRRSGVDPGRRVNQNRRERGRRARDGHVNDRVKGN